MIEAEPLATAALQALGAARTPDVGAAERAWPQMQSRIVDGRAPLEVGGPRVARAGRAIAIGFVLAAVAAAAVLAVGLGQRPTSRAAGPDRGLAPYVTPPDGDGDASVVSPPHRDAIDPAPVRVPPLGVSTEPTAVIETPAAPAPRSVRSRKPEAAAPSPAAEPGAPTDSGKDTSLAAEMRLMAKATRALRDGSPGAALALLDEHKRTFADGQLAPERDHQRAVALCELGRRDQARAAVDAFVRRHPSSPLRSKAEAVCRD